MCRRREVGMAGKKPAALSTAPSEGEESAVVPSSTTKRGPGRPKKDPSLPPAPAPAPAPL